MERLETPSKFSPDAALKFLLTSEAVDDDLTVVLEVLNDDQVLALYCLTMDTADVRVRRLTALASRYRGCLRSALTHLRFLGNGQLDVPGELEKFKERLCKLSHLSTTL